MSKYLDNLDVIDANGDISNVLIRDNEADTKITQVATNLANEVIARQTDVSTLNTNLTAEETARINADNTLDTRITTEVNTLDSRITTEVNTLDGKISTEKTARESADTAINTRIDNLTTYDKADIRNYGGVADDTTDNTQAFLDCMSENNLVYLPNYNNGHAYKFTSELTLTDGQSIIGNEGTNIASTASNCITIVGNNTEIKNLIVTTNNNVIYINSESKALAFIHIENVYSYGASRFIYDNTSATYIYTNLYVNRCAARSHVSYGIDLAKCQAFLIMNDVTIDSVGVIGTVPMFRITNNAGAHLTRCEAEGGYSDGSHSTHAGFVFQDSQAIWLERCMCDTVDGSGFNFTNTQYVYMISCVASLMGAHGIAILSTTCSDFIITNCYIGGRNGMTSYTAGAHGIYNFNDKISVCNTEITNMTGYAIADNASGNNCNYQQINISNCSRSFVSASGAGIIMGCISTITGETPTYGNYNHVANLVNGVFG